MVLPYVQHLATGHVDQKPNITYNREKEAQTHCLVFDIKCTRAAYSLQMVRICRE